MFSTNDWENIAITLAPQDINDKQALKEPQLYKIQLIERPTSYIYYTNIHDASLQEAFKWVTDEVGDDNTLAFDFKFNPDSRKTRNKACFFQIGTCSRLLVIRYIGENCKRGELLKNFLVGHKFIGKDIFCDLKKLYDRFNVSFNNILDMEKVYLRPNKLPTGSVKMCKALGVKTTVEYKKKSGLISKWDESELSKQQVLRSALNVVGLYCSFTAAKALFPEINATEMERKQKNKPREKSLRSVIKRNMKLKEENKRLKLILHFIKQGSKMNE